MKGAEGIKGRKEVVVAVVIGRAVVAVILRTNSKERGRLSNQLPVVGVQRIKFLSEALTIIYVKMNSRVSSVSLELSRMFRLLKTPTQMLVVDLDLLLLKMSLLPNT